MNVAEAIINRRSIRNYTQDFVSDADIDKILTAGTWAPSGLNNQPWALKVVKKEDKDKLAVFTKYKHIIDSAPVAICVFLDHRATYNREKDIMAIGSCIQNMLLQAHELGLGTCWLGEILNKKEQVVKKLDIEDNYELMAVITHGYQQQKVSSPGRKELKQLLI